MTIEQHFHETLLEYYFGGECVFCGRKKWTELCHDISQSKANKKVFGDIIDAPLLNVLPGCHECNMNYVREVIYFPVGVIRAGKAAWRRYYAQKTK